MTEITIKELAEKYKTADGNMCIIGGKEASAFVGIVTVEGHARPHIVRYHPSGRAVGNLHLGSVRQGYDLVAPWPPEVRGGVVWAMFWDDGTMSLGEDLDDHDREGNEDMIAAKRIEWMESEFDDEEESESDRDLSKVRFYTGADAVEFWSEAQIHGPCFLGQLPSSYLTCSKAGGFKIIGSNGRCIAGESCPKPSWIKIGGQTVFRRD